MIIGITGNSGSGKTIISKILAEKINAKIIDADKIAKKMTSNKTEYLKETIKIFGQEILEDDKLNRKKLAEIIYKNKIKKHQLDKLTYKYVAKEIQKEVFSEAGKNVIIDAPLLFESGLNKICEINIAVIAKKSIKIERICKRDKIEIETAKARLAIQRAENYYTRKADYVLENNGKIEEINLEEICTKIGKN